MEFKDSTGVISLRSDDVPSIQSEDKDFEEKNKNLESMHHKKNIVCVSRLKDIKPKKRILFINPPVEEPFIRIKGEANKLKIFPNDSARNFYRSEEDLFINKRYDYNVPIGLLRIANKLLREGYEIYFLDCFASLPINNINSRDRFSFSDEPLIYVSEKILIEHFHLGMKYDEIREIIMDLSNEGLDEVFIGCTFTYHNKSAHKVIEICKEVLPDVRVRFGGIYPTLCPNEAKKSLADEIFIGKFPGVDDEPLNYKILGYVPDYILIKGTRGCPNNCAYCAVHKLEGNKFSFRNPYDVFSEINKKYKEYDARRLVIWDSNLLLDYDSYLGIILKKIIDNKLNLKINAPEGLDYRLINPKIAYDLKRAGFTYVSIALESSDDCFTKDNLKRYNNLELFKKSISYLKEAGFKGNKIKVFLMTGVPGQSVESVINGIKFVWSLGCNVVIFPFTPIPGTEIFNRNLNRYEKFSLLDLHPLRYSCVEKREELELFIEISMLNILNYIDANQRDLFMKTLFSDNLIRKLSTYPH